MNIVKELFLFLIPRFVTDRVALSLDDGVYSVFCLEGDEQPGDKIFIDCYGAIKTIAWFGVGFCGRVLIDEDKK